MDPLLDKLIRETLDELFWTEEAKLSKLPKNNIVEKARKEGYTTLDEVKLYLEIKAKDLKRQYALTLHDIASGYDIDIPIHVIRKANERGEIDNQYLSIAAAEGAGNRMLAEK